MQRRHFLRQSALAGAAAVTARAMPAGEATTGLYRICEINQAGLAVLRTKRRRPFSQSSHMALLAGQFTKPLRH